MAMANSTKYVSVDGRFYDVYNVDTFQNNANQMMDSNKMAVEIGESGTEDGMVLPIRQYVQNQAMDKPGIYMKPNSPVSFLRFPETKEDKEEYCPSGTRLINFGDIQNLQQYADSMQRMKDNEICALETRKEDGDIVYTPPLIETDSAEMRGLKLCIMEKQIDLDKYKDRFGDSYLNDRRKLNDDNITSYLLKRMCNNLDIVVDVVFRDASENVANPMKKIIKINMVPGNDNSAEIVDVK